MALARELIWDDQQGGVGAPGVAVGPKMCFNLGHAINLSGTKQRGNQGPERFSDYPGVTQTAGVRAPTGSEVSSLYPGCLAQTGP